MENLTIAGIQAASYLLPLQIIATVLAWEALKRFASVARDWWQDRKVRKMGINWAGKDAPIWDAKNPEPLSTDEVLDQLNIPEFLRRRQAE